MNAPLQPEAYRPVLSAVLFLLLGLLLVAA
jgi:hypothetical protein